MNILWFTWKDRTHPQAGGAELINEEIAKRLVRDGHQVRLIVGGYPGATREVMRDGYSITRIGNRFTLYWHAFRYYRNHLRGWADWVIDEMNTIPFLCKYYVCEPNILLAYQLCREIWFYQMPQPLSTLGYLVEPIYLRLLNDRHVITESESTKNDLLKYGFHADAIAVIPMGISIAPMENLNSAQKYPVPTVLSLGAIRDMKRTMDQIIAFECAKKTMPDLKMKIAGLPFGAYGGKVLSMIALSRYSKDIEYLGHVSSHDKIALMRQCHVILVTSVKEGWGLIVTEANSQGTPAVVYNVDGLRDSVRHGETGICCSRNTPESLASAVVQLLTNQSEYSRVRENAWRWSRELTLEQSYQGFVQGLTV
jgi:glycosyltransferase involved in cell wall biosynthesis